MRKKFVRLDNAAHQLLITVEDNICFRGQFRTFCQLAIFNFVLDWFCFVLHFVCAVTVFEPG